MNELAILCEKIQTMLSDNGWQEQLSHPDWLAKSICIEAAELLECFQFSSSAEDLQAVKEELADVLIYCLQMCMALDLDMKEIVQEKLEINAGRQSRGNSACT